MMIQWSWEFESLYGLVLVCICFREAGMARAAGQAMINQQMVKEALSAILHIDIQLTDTQLIINYRKGVTKDSSNM